MRAVPSAPIANGQVTYFHQAITPVIVAPGKHEVIPLEPEFITPQDGHAKQDCEQVAAKRWIERQAGRYQQVTILGDDLYCKQPFCELVLQPRLQLHLGLQTGVAHNAVRVAGWGRSCRRAPAVRHPSLEWAVSHRPHLSVCQRGPPARGRRRLWVNWCELTITKETDGTILYRNAFATQHPLDHTNVEAVVQAGRARWKIENENNNTLKTKGYHLEHNYGHGKQHLSAVLLTLNLLAFLFHTVLGWVDHKYHLRAAGPGGPANLFSGPAGLDALPPV